MASITMDAWIKRRQAAMERRGADNIPEEHDEWVALRRKSAFAKADNEKRAWMPLPNPEKLKAIWKKAPFRRRFESEFKELYRLFQGEFDRRYYDAEAPEDSPKVERKLKTRGGGTVAKPWSPMIRLAEKVAGLTDGQLEILIEDIHTVRSNLEELGVDFSEFDAEDAEDEGAETEDGEEEPDGSAEDGFNPDAGGDDEEGPDEDDPENYDPEDDVDDLDDTVDDGGEDGGDGADPELEGEDADPEDEGDLGDSADPEDEGDLGDSADPEDEGDDRDERLIAAFAEIMAEAFSAAANAFSDSVMQQLMDRKVFRPDPDEDAEG